MVLYGLDTMENKAQAHELLALACEQVWGLSPMPEPELHPLGKPFFADFPEKQFNLSHSGTFALCGLDAQPVGVDIQIVKKFRPGLARRVCSQAELDWLDRQEDYTLGFCTLWALKECKVKQSGTGIRSDLRKTAVPLPERRDGPVFFEQLWFRTYQSENGDWAAAACGLTPPPEKIQWIPLSSGPSLRQNTPLQSAEILV